MSYFLRKEACEMRIEHRSKEETTETKLLGYLLAHGYKDLRNKKLSPGLMKEIERKADITRFTFCGLFF